MLPLAGLKVRLAHAQHQHVLYLAQRGGRVRVQRYARGDHDEDTVRGFAKRLESAVADENAFLIRVAAQLEEAEEDLARARGDTRAQEEAQARVAGIEERRRNDTRRQTAQKELDAARDRWSRLTGRRPR